MGDLEVVMGDLAMEVQIQIIMVETEEQILKCPTIPPIPPAHQRQPPMLQLLPLPFTPPPPQPPLLLQQHMRQNPLHLPRIDPLRRLTLLQSYQYIHRPTPFHLIVHQHPPTDIQPILPVQDTVTQPDTLTPNTSRWKPITIGSTLSKTIITMILDTRKVDMGTPPLAYIMFLCQTGASKQ